MANNDIKELWVKALQAGQRLQTFAGLLGDGNNNLYLSDGADNYQKNWIWCRILKPASTGAVKVRCLNAAPVYNAPVWVQQNPVTNEWEVIGLRAEESANFFETFQTSNVGPHSAQHNYLGPDPIKVQALQYEPLVTQPLTWSPLRVQVNGLTWRDGYGSLNYWQGGNINLASLRPNVPDRQTAILLGFDTLTGTLDYYTSGEWAYTPSPYIPFSPQDIYNDVGSLPETFIPSALVRLYAEQERIEFFDIFADARPWLTNSIAEVNTTVVNPYFGGAYTSSAFSTGFQVIEFNGNRASGISYDDTNGHITLDAGIYSVRLSGLFYWNTGQVTAGTDGNWWLILNSEDTADVLDDITPANCQGNFYPANDTSHATSLGIEYTIEMASSGFIVLGVDLPTVTTKLVSATFNLTIQLLET